MKHSKLSQYIVLVDFLGKVLGPDFEIVLHDLTGHHKQVIAIANGHISGRKVGSPLTNTALKLINSKSYETQDYAYNYIGVSEKGHTLRSSTLFLKNNAGQLEGLLCINFDDSRYQQLNQQLLELLHGTEFPNCIQKIDVEKNIQEQPSEHTEKFPTDLSSLMQHIFNDVMTNISVAPDHLNQEEKIEIISQLKEQGLFQLKGSIPFVAKQLSCSTSSIYRYLGNLE